METIDKFQREIISLVGKKEMSAIDGLFMMIKEYKSENEELKHKITELHGEINGIEAARKRDFEERHDHLTTTDIIRLFNQKLRHGDVKISIERGHDYFLNVSFEETGL